MICALLFLVIITALACSECGAGSLMLRYESKADYKDFALSHSAWNDSRAAIVVDSSAPSAGIVESPAIPVPAGFDQALVSWNAQTPAGAYLTVYMQARIDGNWTCWYNMGLWNTDGRPKPRTSLNGQDDDMGKVSTETLELKKRADAFKVKLELSSVDGVTYPSLRLLAVNVTDTSNWRADLPPVKEVWGTELDVPELCQNSVPGGNVWCSPTSTAMVLGYWSKLLKRPELTIGITEAATAIFDVAWNGTGNWVFNTAYAGEFEGIRAYVTRFDSVSQIEEWIAKGVPVIVSVDYNKLNRRNEHEGGGHLMVIRGFTEAGSPIFNDPWAVHEKGEKNRKIFKRSDLEHAWLGPNGAYGTVYLIYPVEMP